MQRTETMAARLPQLYRDGELIRGSVSGRTGGLLDAPAVQLELVDEDGREIQVAHWFDTARHLDEVAKLALLLDFVPEPWQTLPLFRAWVHALRNAMLTEGAVTADGIQTFVEEYARGYQAATRIAAVGRIGEWVDRPSPSDPAFVENPPRLVAARVPGSGGIEPLHQFELVNQGLDETPASFLMTGFADASEYVPALVNVTSGEALIFLGAVPPGARLWIQPAANGEVRAFLENRDVTSQLYSVTAVVPGSPWKQSSVRRPARAITLRRGVNALWFLPLAHYDALGLDRFLLALPELALQQGRFDASSFDRALFHQDAAVVVRVWWVETQPARFEVVLPAGAMVSPRQQIARALDDRLTLERSLNTGVSKLRAAGVASQVTLRAFTEAQPQLDFVTAMMPRIHREGGPMGADRLPDAGGVFEVTPFDDSTYR